MPRGPRPIHTERAFHVFNRGNYRLPIFETEGAREAFLKELAVTASGFGWVVYAYALMPNHYHLCLRTPRGNLSDGMQSLLTAFAARFNHFRDESGHVFQGRFKCTVASEGVSARRIIDYIHLNPAQAGLGEVGSATSLEMTSLGAYLDPGKRGLVSAEEGLVRFLGYEDTLEGRLGYAEALSEALKTDPKGENFKADVKTAAKEEARLARKAARPIRDEVRLGRETARRLEIQRWEKAAAHLLEKHRLESADLSALPKAFGAKLEIARELRLKLGASYSWLAERLKAGTPDALRTRLKEQKGSDPTSA
ncbi:MAG: transposase [Opitutia bacterium]